MRTRIRQIAIPTPRRPPSAAGLRASAALWLPLLLVIALLAPGQAASEEPDLSDAMEEQQALLAQVGDEALIEKEEQAIRAQPQVAPEAPIPRDLPAGIFDEEKVTIAKGQWGNRKQMVLIRRVLDADGDGKPEIERFIDPKSDLMIRQVMDQNYDGVPDTWDDFEWGVITHRVLDTNDDGNPDVWESYADGFMSRREVDRNDDGVRDAFYTFDGDSLTKEEHDANDDGRIDRMIRYQNRKRTRVEEDRDKDGRMDEWTVYLTNTEVASQFHVDIPERISRDTKGTGVPDTWDYFQPVDGKAQRIRREEDVTGNGRIDIVSIYLDGKLVRREISDPALVPGA